MENGIITGALFLTTLLSPAPTPTPQITSQIVQIDEMRDYRVEAGDTLGSIAKKEYGSEDLWVNIWNDNDFIKDPNLIEKNWKLKLHSKKPLIKEELKPSLAKTQELKQQQAQIEAIKAQEPTITVTPTTSPAPVQMAAQTPNTSPKSLNDAQIAFLGQCESGMTATRNSGNGYYGAFQFSIGTWNSMNTGYERADLAPLEVQIDAVQRLLQRSSIFHQFPGCAKRMHLAGLL